MRQCPRHHYWLEIETTGYLIAKQMKESHSCLNCIYSFSQEYWKETYRKTEKEPMRAAASSWNLQSSQGLISSKINSSTAQWVSNNGHSGVWGLRHIHFLSTSVQKNDGNLHIRLLLWIQISSTKVFEKIMSDEKKSYTTFRYHSPGNDKQHTANTKVGQQDVDPDIWGHGLEEGEEPGVGIVWTAVKDADPCVQKWLWEVDHFLSHKGDGKGSYGQICSLNTREKKQYKHHVQYSLYCNGQFKKNKFAMQSVSIIYYFRCFNLNDVIIIIYST